MFEVPNRLNCQEHWLYKKKAKSMSNNHCVKIDKVMFWWKEYQTWPETRPNPKYDLLRQKSESDPKITRLTENDLKLELHF